MFICRHCGQGLIDAVFLAADKHYSLGTMMLESIRDEISSSKLLKWLTILFVVALLCATAILTLYFFTFNHSLSTENGDWGTFGDFFGGTLNPFLSFLSLIAISFTILLQSREQERATEFQKESEKSLKAQHEAQKKQIFEQTFFSLLSQSNNILDKLSLYPNEMHTNKESTLKNIHISMLNDQTDPALSKKTLSTKNSYCGHYFRNLYQLLKFIAINRPNSEISANFTPEEISSAPLSAEEKMYSTIVRSFISHEVAQILAINCLCTNSADPYWKYKLLIERYAFLEHMPFEISGQKNQALLALISHYDKIAFGESEFLNALASRRA